MPGEGGKGWRWAILEQQVIRSVWGREIPSKLKLSNVIFASTLVFYPSNLPTSKYRCSTKKVFTSDLQWDIAASLKNVINIMSGFSSN
jgi:hypothetical protein